ncbi:MAG: NUDIX domain-containing protein [Candidatus Schmidhempelia sp.]|nr:NUDIX domain-containing protein [Candidatus Schmidhempelia sp.]
MNLSSTTIYISAAIITNDKQQLLLVRKKGSPYFMQAGGKIEANETPLQALIRELQEELKLTVTAKQLRYIGHYSSTAANEINHMLSAVLYHLPLTAGNFNPAAELEEVRWMTIEQSQQLLLAPLTAEIIIPIIKKTIFN